MDIGICRNPWLGLFVWCDNLSQSEIKKKKNPHTTVTSARVKKKKKSLQMSNVSLHFVSCEQTGSTSSLLQFLPCSLFFYGEEVQLYILLRVNYWRDRSCFSVEEVVFLRISEDQRLCAQLFKEDVLFQIPSFFPWALVKAVSWSGLFWIWSLSP